MSFMALVPFALVVRSHERSAGCPLRGRALNQRGVASVGGARRDRGRLCGLSGVRELG